MTDNSPAIATASVNWTDDGGVQHIRVYSSDGDNITERCWDGSAWVNGGFKEAGTTVSATCWWVKNDCVRIRVYATASFEGTTEWCYDSPSQGWYKGAYTAS